MARKKKEKIECKEKVIVGNNGSCEIVTRKVECLKPLPNKDGMYSVADTLNYLVKIIPQTDSSFGTILSLASYVAYNNNLPASEKQYDLIMHFIEYWQDKGVLDIERRNKKQYGCNKK